MAPSLRRSSCGRLWPALVGVLLLSACATHLPGPPAAPRPDEGPSGGSSTVVRPSGGGSAADGVSRPSLPAQSPPSAGAPVAANGAALPHLHPPVGPSWRSSPSTDAVQVATLPGGMVSLMWMDPTRLRFRYVPGRRVPEGGPATVADRTPSTWVPRMVAGFDSGYKLSDHVGGYLYLNRTVAPLRAGLGSMVLRTDGSLTVGAWGRDIGLTPDTLVVRQNLRPLVLDGVSQASRRDGVRTWGKANGDRPLANRSALGLLPDGSLVFVFAHSVTAASVAGVLVSVGVRQAVMLDMNVSWPTGFVYAHVGGRVVGERINRFVVRPPSTYLSRFTKDFVVVEPR